MASKDINNSKELYYIERNSNKRNHDVEENTFGHEKRKASGIGTVIANHYNSIEEKGLVVRNESRILFMRNFNNWIKSVLIHKFLEKIKEGTPDDYKIIALDLGCGKGGDMVKWRKGRIWHLICADIAQVSIEQCQERYEFTKKKEREKIFSAEFIVADATRVDLQKHLKCPGVKMDMVSCQFSFHYCFESLPQAETMVRNISECLRPGGYFVGTIPDANAIMSNLQSSSSNSFGNEVFKISFLDDRPSEPKLFGDKYNFYLEGVVNCPEFLVHFPTLVRLCKKYKLDLIYLKSFEEIYKEGMADRDTRSLLFKMKALELYPPYRGCQPVGRDDETEYSHAKTYLERTGESKVKTISMSEWEAVCLYIGFAFKKC